MFQVPGYTIEAEWWRDGHARVFLARETATQHRVVLEAYPPMELPVNEPDWRLRTFRCLEAVSCLQHDHIWPVLKLGEHQRLFYLIRPYEPVTLLEDVIHSERPQVRNAVTWIRDIALAVQHAHDHGICFVDISPGVVVLRPGGSPWIRGFENVFVDFLPLPLRLETHAIYGRPVFLAPEIFRLGRKEFRPGADVWSLGILLYRLLAGRMPFAGPNFVDLVLQTMEASPEPLRQVAPSVDTDLDWLCMRCLQRDPSNRPANAASLARLLDEYLAGRPLAPVPIQGLARRLMQQLRGLIARR